LKRLRLILGDLSYPDYQQLPAEIRRALQDPAGRF
jgi:hypothetical protein